MYLWQNEAHLVLAIRIVNFLFAVWWFVFFCLICCIDLYLER